MNDTLFALALTSPPESRSETTLFLCSSIAAAARADNARRHNDEHCNCLQATTSGAMCAKGNGALHFCAFYQEQKRGKTSSDIN